MKLSKGFWKHLILWTVVVLVLVVGILIWRLDSVVAAAVRSVGPKITGTPVKLESVSISLWSGKFSFKGFAVGNPSGFQAEDAIKVGNFNLEIDMGSLSKDTIVIRKLELSGVAVNYELQIPKSNLDVILDHVNQLSAKEEKAGARPAAAQESPGKKVVIDELRLSDSQVSVSAAALKNRLVLPLAPIVMYHVGDGKGMAYAVSAILQKILLAVIGVVNDSGVLQKAGEVVLKGEELVQKQLDDIDKKIESGVVSAGDSAGKALDGALKETNRILKSLPGLQK